MNTKIFFIIISLSLAVITTISAKDKKDKIQKKEFEVKGVCDECKERIENAALIKGVKRAEWNKEKGLITVIYDTTKIDIIKVHKSIALAGHATSKEKADVKAYENLPECCKYNHGVEKH